MIIVRENNMRIMERPYSIPYISDQEFDNLSSLEQDQYNRAIGAKNEYNEARENYDTSMSLLGPTILGVVGGLLCLLFGGLLLGAIIGVVVLVCIILSAALWAVIRVSARSHAYQLLKDTEMRLDAIPPLKIAPKPRVDLPTPVPGPDPKGRKKAIIRGVKIGVIVVAIIIGIYLILTYQAGSSYCLTHYPGTHYNLLANHCDL